MCRSGVFSVTVASTNCGSRSSFSSCARIFWRPLGPGSVCRMARQSRANCSRVALMGRIVPPSSTVLPQSRVLEREPRLAAEQALQRVDDEAVHFVGALLPRQRCHLLLHGVGIREVGLVSDRAHTRLPSPPGFTSVYRLAHQPRNFSYSAAMSMRPAVLRTATWYVVMTASFVGGIVAREGGRPSEAGVPGLSEKCLG